MHATLEETDRHVVRLDIEVPPDEVARDLDSAYRKVGSKAKIPGFRKGKVPKQIIDARMGREAVLEEFVQEFVPRYYALAVREHELAPISNPEITVDTDDMKDGQPLRFSVTVEVRPRLTLTPEQYRGIEIEAPSTEPRELEIDEFVDRLRERFAELEVISRPAGKGDYVLADVRASVHDREISEATRVGFLSEIGSEELVPELDRELEGKRKGDILKFNAVLPESFGPDLTGTEVTFQVLVKEVKSKKLPPADDDFARTASEFDTLEELREDVRAKLRTMKEREAVAAGRDLVLQRLTDTIDIELPDRLVDEETEARVRRAHQRAEQAGVTLEQVLEQQGWDELRFRSDARSHAIRALKSDLVLEAVARQEGLKVTKEDLDKEVKDLAEASGRDPKEVRRIIDRSGQAASLAGDIIRSKALDLLVEAADRTSLGSTVPERTPEPDLSTTTEEDSR
jgi:trigger factor